LKCQISFECGCHFRTSKGEIKLSGRYSSIAEVALDLKDRSLELGHRIESMGLPLPGDTALVAEALYVGTRRQTSIFTKVALVFLFTPILLQ
jgi:hypothetical protein